MTSDKPRGHEAAGLLLSSRVRIRDLLEIVGAVGPDRDAVNRGVHELYEWHHRRAMAGLQLTFAPATAAILAIVAKPSSQAVVVVAGIVIAIALLLGIVQIVVLNWLHGESVIAMRLAAALAPHGVELGRYPHGIGASEDSLAYKLYNDYGNVSLVTYRRTDTVRREIVTLLQ